MRANLDFLLENSPEITPLIHPRVFQMAAAKIDKVSGDIRVCFEILRQTLERKSSELKSMMLARGDQNSSNSSLGFKQLAIGMSDVNKVIVDMFESKLTKFIKKIP